MTEATASGAEGAARARVAALLDWARDELGMAESAFRGCTDGERSRLALACGVRALPSAYDEFLARAGHTGVGAAPHELFPGDDVAIESMMPDGEWLGGPGLAADLLREHGFELEATGPPVVVWMRRGTHVACIGSEEGVDPPVIAFGGNGESPHQIAPSFTAWLERAIHRAIKRRYPLRDADFAV